MSVPEIGQKTRNLFERKESIDDYYYYYYYVY
jgi:hypothetical protein